MSGGASQIIENLGQAPQGWGEFYLKGGDASIAFRTGGLTIAIGSGYRSDVRGTSSYDIVFEGANPVAPQGTGPTGTTFNFFLGNDSSRWVSGARGFSEVRYPGIWNGIDLVYRLVGTRLKYDLVVAPGAHVSSVRLSYVRVDSMSLDKGTGALLVSTVRGTCMDDSPISYQESPQGRIPIESRFVLIGPRIVGFEVGGYDASRPLFVDPELMFSTFLGTTSNEFAEACDTSPSGDLYVLGVTRSSSFPTTSDGFDRSYNGGYDLFVSRFSADGTQLLNCTYIGGSSDDNSPYGSSPYDVYSGYGGIWVDGTGNVFVTGHTTSDNFPATPGAFDRSYSSSSYDGFVSKLAPDLDQLLFSTYVGGAQNDHPIDICGDSNGNPIISGYTWGSGYPTTSGAYDTTFSGIADAFVTKFNASGDKLLYSTFLGGSANDIAYAVAVDSNDITYVAGYTEGSGFPTTSGAYDTSINGGFDMFVLKLDADWTHMTYSTFVGSSYADYGVDLAIDNQGRAYVVGFVLGTGFPMVPGCYDTSYNGDIEVVVFKLSGLGSALEKSTYFGTSAEDKAYSLALAPNGDVILGGFSEESVPTTANAYDSSHHGGFDAFVARFDDGLSTLEYGSMFGSPGDDKAWDLVVDPEEGTTFLVGHTTDDSFPTTASAYDTSYSGGYDAFVLKLGEVNPPYWRPLPPFSAVEDVPRVLNFSSLVADIDTPAGRLSLTSVSPFVVSTSGLEATFQFPNGVTAASVPLGVSDGGSLAIGYVNFTITPVNDAPTCSIPTERTAREDEPLTIDLAPYIRDVDSPMSSLFLIVVSPYASAVGLNLTIKLPDGVLSYDLYLNVSDGLDATEIHLHFTGEPVDDPPVVAPLPPLTVMEDRVTDFNITPYLMDNDTIVSELKVLVRDANCTVSGQVLHLLFKKGNVDTSVSFEVTDAHNRVTAVLRVHVTDVNDPPIVHGVSPKLFKENQPKTVNLSAYIDDEDTPRDRLVLECRDPHLVLPIVGFNLTFLYTTWEPEQTIVFSVSDGIARTNGSFDIQVQAVNDPPVILGIGDLTSPVTISIEEGAELYLQIRVSDEDSISFKYTIVSKWSGITAFQNGTVRVSPAPGNVGNFTATLSVDDLGGGNTTLPIAIRVLNVNDPPTVPILVLPQNHTIVEEGTSVTFSVDVLDPDTSLGQVLTVTWVSNVSGLIRVLMSNHTLMFSTDRLPVGVHRVTVTVTDGRYVRGAWLELTVTAKYVPPPPPPDGPSLLKGMTGLVAVVIIIVLVIVGILLVVVMGRRRGAEEEEVERASAVSSTTPPPEPVMAPITMEGDLATLGRSLGDMATQLEATRAAEAKTAAALPAGPAPEQVGAPVQVSEAEEADRVHTREVREVMRALTQLPQGLPTTMWGWDMSELARAIVDGEKRTTPDGTPLVKVKGKWYNADRTNVGVFVREWKEPEAPVAPVLAATTAEKRDRKLEQLETGLLEGKISEQTYRELKRKYEDGG